MSSRTIEQFATQAAIASLNVYQQHISPRKGFACPHRLLYGGISCSEYVKQSLTQQNIVAAVQMAPSRFRACKAAAQKLHAQAGCIVIPCCIPI